MAEGGGVPDQLVHHVRLRRVERPARMADVLGGEEDPATEMPEEGAVRDQPRDGLHGEAGRTPQDLVHLGELRDALAVEAHQVCALPIRLAGVFRVHPIEMLPDGPPDALLVFGVLDRRDRVALPELHGDPRNGVAARAIGRISESGMVGIELHEVGCGYRIPVGHQPFRIPGTEGPLPVDYRPPRATSSRPAARSTFARSCSVAGSPGFNEASAFCRSCSSWAARCGSSSSARFASSTRTRTRPLLTSAKPSPAAYRCVVPPAM